MIKIKIYRLILISLLFFQCSSDVEEESMIIPAKFQLEALSSPAHYPGIALYTVDMAKNRVSDVNSEWVIRKSSSVIVSSNIQRNKFNAIHKINYENLRNNDDYFEFVLAIHGKLTNRIPVPNDFLKELTGISFRAVSYDIPITITVEAQDINNSVLKSQDFDLSTDKMNEFKMDITNQSLHHISFKVQKNKQDIENTRTGSIALDDIYLNNNANSTFSPPNDDIQLIQWLKESSIRYFLWNYKELDANQGVVLEASDDANKVSVSGIGYGYAMYILAESEGMINPQEAKAKILAMLNWQKAQNWFNGTQGKFGFPFHYYNSDGSGLYSNSPEAASTIDWAICAAGLRTVKQKYSSDPTIIAICDELLNRPEWERMIHNQANDTYRYGRITKGISGITGGKNGQVWGDAFTEESEIIYLEALASGKVNDLDLDRIFREQKNGFYVSWFGSGFTYNWSQLWTGAVEPYKTNSINAYQADATSCLSSFGKPFMGLTACSTISNSDSNGFLNWNTYVGNQGASVSGANTSEVIQLSPATYGSALALPFDSNRAIVALKEFVKVGYYHPLLGLPDNIRLKDFPTSIDVPVPNWSTFDINIGPMGMAIDMYQNKVISSLYLKDNNIKNSLDKLIQSFKKKKEYE
jgi:hypothetical protein